MKVVLPGHALVKQQCNGSLDTILAPRETLLDLVDRHTSLSILGQGHDLHVIVVQFGRDAHDHVRLSDLDDPKTSPQGAQFFDRNANVSHVVQVFFLAALAAPVAIQRVADLRYGHNAAVLGPRRETDFRHLDGQFIVKVPDANSQSLGPKALLRNEGIDAEGGAHLQKLLAKGRIVLDVRLVLLGKIGQLDLEFFDRIDGGLNRQRVHLVGFLLELVFHRYGSAAASPACFGAAPPLARRWRPGRTSRTGVGPRSTDAHSSASVCHYCLYDLVLVVLNNDLRYRLEIV